MKNFLQFSFFIVLTSSYFVKTYKIDERINEDIEKIIRRNFAKEIASDPELFINIKNSAVLKNAFKEKINSSKYVGKIDELQKVILPYIESYVTWRNKNKQDWKNAKQSILEKYSHFDVFIDPAIKFWWKTSKGASNVSKVIGSGKTTQIIDYLIQPFYNNASQENKNLVHKSIQKYIVESSEIQFRNSMIEFVKYLNETENSKANMFYDLKMLFKIEGLLSKSEIYNDFVKIQVGSYDNLRRKFIEFNENFEIFIDDAIKYWWKSGKNSSYFEKKIENIHETELASKILDDITEYYESSNNSKELIKRTIDINILRHENYINYFEERELKEKLKYLSHHPEMLFNFKNLKNKLENIVVTTTSVTITTQITTPRPKTPTFNCTKDIKQFIKDSTFQLSTSKKKSEIERDICIETEICSSITKKKEKKFKKEFIQPYIDFVENFIIETDEVDDMFFDMIGEFLIEIHNFTRDQAYCAEKFMKRDAEFKNSYTGVELLTNDSELKNIAQKVAKKYKNLYL